MTSGNQASDFDYQRLTIQEVSSDGVGPEGVVADLRLRRSSPSLPRQPAENQWLQRGPPTANP